MRTAFPDNAINLELFNRLNNLDVNGTTFKFFVQRVPEDVNFYFLKSTQPSQEGGVTKCGKGWETSTEIQVVVILPKRSGSEKILNRAVAELMIQLDDFSLSSPFVVNQVTLSVDNNLTEVVGGNVVHRKIVRMETIIN